MDKIYSVRLENCDKIEAIKVYREITGVSLKEAKTIIDKTPGVIFDNLTISEANAIANKFRVNNCPSTVIKEQSFAHESESREAPKYEGPDISTLEGKELLDKLMKAKDTILAAEQLQAHLESIAKAKEEVEKKRKSIETKSGIITYLGTVIGALIGIVAFQFIGLIIGLVAGWFISGIIDGVVNGKKNSEKAKNYYDENYPPLVRKGNELKEEARIFFDSPEFIEVREVIPTDYFDSVSAEYLVKVVENKRANSIKECINLYEEYLFRTKVEEMQKQQVEIAKESANTQKEIAKAAKQQADSAREIARNTRATTRAVRLNNFITFFKD